MSVIYLVIGPYYRPYRTLMCQIMSVRGRVVETGVNDEIGGSMVFEFFRRTFGGDFPYCHRNNYLFFEIRLPNIKGTTVLE